MKYQKQALLGLLGMGLIISPWLSQLPAQFKTYNSGITIRESEELERIKAEQRAATADKINELGVMPSFKKLRINDYLDSTRFNPRPNTTGYLEDEIVFVYDSMGKCVGRIEQRQWKWKYRFKNACKNSPLYQDSPN
ncbi:hypothetical protein H6G76_29205 [Nostoc sp. FACHB-152]|uniref:hypothetical protein n=1 Tax=unclassified Nostoc TaxID=2593658 RepID=UPI00168A1845|nr:MULTISPECIES: hypothetical protein [unclassified Nostoc]MBD2451137.1 hypothetical protein [Nostoc sp. FACHB-152]MBD2473143.1 hypothetical protein [Nostoc sp. FACHB-145]